MPGDADANNVYDVVVQVSDGTRSDSQAIAVTVSDVNEYDPVIAGGDSAAVTINENVNVVTTISATDLDLTASLSFSIAGGADASKFQINEQTGVLTLINAANAESPADAGADGVYDVTVQVSDGQRTDSQAISVTVQNVNDVAPAITSAAAVSVQENSTAVVTVTAEDADGPATSFSLDGGADAGLFTIDATTGALSFVSAPDFEAPADAGADNVYDVVVRVSDGELSSSQSIAVTVSDVSEGPVIDSNGGGDAASISVAENNAFVTTVTTVAPAPAGTTRSFTLSGTDASRFSISTSGVLTFVAAPDFEAPADAGGNNVYDVVVEVADGAFTDTQAIAVSVTNVAGVTLNGTIGADTLNGTAEEDRLNGLASNDTLNGGAGNDTLDGGLGSDSMVGGLGNDTYQVEVAGDIVSELAGQGRDTVRTTLTSYTLGANVEDLTYTGTANFSGTGNAENNSITGGAGLDNLNGGIGNDTLNGGTGGDVMAGGAGDDTYYVDAAGDLVNELAQVGMDTVNTTLSAYTLGSNVENLTYIGSGNFIGTGNSWMNLMIGGAGNDTLSAANGNDRLIGGAGNDTLDGGAGNDVFVFAAGFGTDRINGFDAVAETVGAQDKLEFSGTDFGSLVIAADGLNTLVTWGADSITLANVNRADIDATDFVFNP